MSKKILITRTRKQSQPFADALEKAGFEPVFFPTISIDVVDDLRALEEAVANIEKYDWVIFTSTNAVEVFFSQFPSPFRRGAGGEVKIAAVGTKTAEALQERGIEVNLVPDEFMGEGLLKSLGDVTGKRFLLPRAKIARKILPDEIRKAGGILDEFAIYETVAATPTAEEIKSLRAGVDVITFTSPSTAKNFVKLAKEIGIDPFHLKNNPLIACIGPVTEKAAREIGFASIVVAETYTTDGLVEILKKYSS